MFHSSPARWLAALPVFAALTAVAQTAPLASGAPAAEVTAALIFRSALDGYQAFTDEKPIAWREANDTVQQRGGWRAYARDAAGKDSAEGDPSRPGADGHSGHAMPMPAEKVQP